MQRHLPSLLILNLCIFSASSHLFGQAEQQNVVAYRILKRHCFECHGTTKNEGDLRLDQPIVDSSPHVLDLQNPKNSLLLERVSHAKGHSARMPPTGPGLDPSEIDALTNWIEQGAQWPDDESIQIHWSYLPPKRPKVPLNSSEHGRWETSPLDAFVSQQLSMQGLQPAPREAPNRLLRRLYLDLIGLPPPADVAQKFAENPSEDEYVRIVESLLANPAFGERWARVWLDAARYADSHGFQRDDLRDIWPYRDWVIQAFNDDIPFDQFTIEQLAGDLLPNATEDQKIATGFLRCSPTNVEAGSLPEETRIEQIFDRVNTIGTIWLGSTIECCQCHDHKYDPFTIQDYYQLFAYFNSMETEASLADPKVPSSIKFQGPYLELHDANLQRQREDLSRALQQARETLHSRTSKLSERMTDWYASFQARHTQTAELHLLEIRNFESQGTTDGHKILEDGSLLLTGGDPPDIDTYEIVAARAVRDIRAIRLDALKHPSLPGNGPGRGDPVRTNFVLNEFTADVVKIDQQTNPSKPSNTTVKKLKFTAASADFSQQKYPVQHAIDGEPNTGWAIAPQFDREHHAIFHLTSPLNLEETQALRIRLIQNYGSGRTLGRFRLTVLTGDSVSPPLPAAIHKLISKPIEKLAPEERVQILDIYQQSDPESVQLKKRIVTLENQLTKLKPIQTLVAAELPTRRPSHIFERGDYQQLGPEVSPSVPSLFRTEGTPSPEPSTKNRLQLARWLISPENPLASRAAVNRWWSEIFGNGIVTTPEDFGIKGNPPSHPELLDWLVLYFDEHNRSLKQLLKLIVLSETYRQASATSATELQIDPENRWLARGPRFRLDAETIRDSLLTISGQLALKQKGPPIYPLQPEGLWTKIGGQVYNYETSPAGEANRRSIYVIWKRASPYPSLMNFDASNRLVCSVRRSRTNTPLQALTLLNDPVYVQAAKKFAQRIQQETLGKSWSEQLEQAFWIALGRPPTLKEQQRLKTLFEAVIAEQPVTLSPQVREQIGWFEIATALLNLHETITKE